MHPLWRRQAVLTAMAVVAFGGVALLTQVVLSDWGRSPDNRTVLYGAVFLTATAMVALMVAVCLHAFRIARLTFRSLDAPETD